MTTKMKPIATILSIIMLIALAGFAAGAADAVDVGSGRQITGYGTVDWSAAAQGYIEFTASGAERVLVLQGPGGGQASYAADEGETIRIALEDGSGNYCYAIGEYADGGTACRIIYKNSFAVSGIGADIAP